MQRRASRELVAVVHGMHSVCVRVCVLFCFLTIIHIDIVDERGERC